MSPRLTVFDENTVQLKADLFAIPLLFILRTQSIPQSTLMFAAELLNFAVVLQSLPVFSRISQSRFAGFCRRVNRNQTTKSGRTLRRRSVRRPDRLQATTLGSSERARPECRRPERRQQQRRRRRRRAAVAGFRSPTRPCYQSSRAHVAFKPISFTSSGWQKRNFVAEMFRGVRFFLRQELFCCQAEI